MLCSGIVGSVVWKPNSIALEVKSEMVLCTSCRWISRLMSFAYTNADVKNLEFEAFRNL